uniref:Uncharacterized protein n=1 Tax=Romanomermis culicivorax TaxID=13658 RepID=A0A915IUJ6_ROMCU
MQEKINAVRLDNEKEEMRAVTGMYELKNKKIKLRGVITEDAQDYETQCTKLQKICRVVEFLRNRVLKGTSRRNL